MMRLAWALVVMLLCGVCATPACAFFFAENTAPQSAANGIVIGPDGNFWVAEEYAGSVAQISPSGTVVGRWDVGDDPISVVNGPGDRVWVAVHNANKLVWFDAKSPTPTPHDVPIPSSCGPVALAAGNDGYVYFSVPDPDNTCNNGNHQLGKTKDDGSGGTTFTSAGNGMSFDLEVTGGKLFAPDFNGGVIRRLALGTMTVESTISIDSNNSEPDGITSDNAGNLWVTEFGLGKVAKFPVSQDGGSATEYTPTGGAIQSPFGIVQGTDGRIYVAGEDSANIMRMNTDGTGFQFYPLTDTNAQPFQIINGTDGDLFFTDQSKTRIVQLVNAPPRATTGAVKASGPTSALAKASVDPRGNDTDVVFEYGTTTKYGKTSDPVKVPNGITPVDVTAGLTKLKPETTYHVRARATSPEGVVYGADAVIKTPPFPVLETSTTFHADLFNGYLVMRDILIDRLRGSETAVVSCAGKKCPFGSKKVKLKRGKVTLKLKALRRKHLRPGTTIIVRVGAPRTIGTYSALHVTKQARADITHTCLRPKSKKPSKCP